MGQFESGHSSMQILSCRDGIEEIEVCPLSSGTGIESVADPAELVKMLAHVYNVNSTHCTRSNDRGKMNLNCEDCKKKTPHSPYSLRPSQSPHGNNSAGKSQLTSRRRTPLPARSRSQNRKNAFGPASVASSSRPMALTGKSPPNATCGKSSKYASHCSVRASNLQMTSCRE